ncbi:Serine--glyoxylate aminotransferase [Candidatus Rhodobacter oscarellae]|uniref:Serine--glyoxylate aminotransferase n=1 Tax=Candidatus Rhodobacter oscarellae TaxID=1675527 RepID=A0A0J9E6K9_9RHOB|nr:aminotransferase class V-fold PLP-dependent enzyme [Candidatus Rhodobacter lobularis]KMW58410.1 Serine--glyoxylate aminotransferase [Candidatus Rhodobacter lobularis]
MTLSNGRHYLAIPGPSVAPDEVLRAMHRPSPNIYEGPLVDMVPGIVADLKKVARTEGEAVIYIANGHGAWEAALANTHSRGDRSLVLATGRFGHGWAEMAERMGVICDVLDFGRSDTHDLERVEAALRARDDYASVLVTHVDTSSSVLNDVAAVRALMDRVGSGALLMADCIASLACDRFEMDALGVDVMVAGCQKGLMVPPGMSYVFFNAKADAARETANCVTSYWDWRPRAAPEDFYQYFGGTAPTHHLYGQRAALDMIFAEGLEAVWARHRALAGAVWAALDCWAQDGPLRMNIGDPALRSNAVTAVSIGKPHGAQLRGWLTQNAGVTLGIGLGMATEEDPASEGYFRIGHMGHVNAQMVLGLLGTMEAGMRALQVPFGAGALEAAAMACTEAG